MFRASYDENNLLQSFRRRAHLLNLPVIPPLKGTDQWMFLARHVGLPTRLLDWTEGALVALYFALREVEDYEERRTSAKPRARGVVWVLNPMRLNRIALMFEQTQGMTVDPQELEEPLGNYYGLTWFNRKHHDGVLNISHENIAGAWELNQRGIHLPVAIEPTTIHPRMNAQHSYFTVHGSERTPLHSIIQAAVDKLKTEAVCEYNTDDVLRMHIVDIDPADGMAELRTLGIADSTIMPDADSLAKELRRFMGS